MIDPAIGALIKRAAKANAVIGIIADNGRRFFFSKAHDRVSRFDIDGYGQVWYIDHHTGLRMAPLAGLWIGFTNGSTAQALILAIAQYIETGALVPFAHFQENWGYGGAMKLVQDAVIKTKAVAQQGEKDGKPEQQQTAA